MEKVPLKKKLDEFESHFLTGMKVDDKVDIGSPTHFLILTCWRWGTGNDECGGMNLKLVYLAFKNNPNPAVLFKSF